MDPITTNTLNKNNVYTTRYFNNGTINADFIKTSDGQLVNVKDIASEIELEDIRDDIRDVNTYLSELNTKYNNLQGDVDLMSIDIQSDLFTPLYTNSNELTRMSALTEYVNNSVSTSISNSAMASDPFFALMNVNTSLTSTVQISFMNMRNHPFNNSLTNLKALSFGSVEFIAPIAPVSTTLIFNIIDCCDRYFDFTINLDEIAVSTSLANGIPIFIPDRVLNIQDGTVYKLRMLKAGGVLKGFNPSSTNVGHMYLFIRNVLRLVNNCLSNVFTAGSSTWSNSYLNIIFCGEIGLDSYNSSNAVNNNNMRCYSLWSPGRPAYIYQAIGVFINNYYLVLSPGTSEINFSVYMMNNTSGAKSVGTIWLPYYSCGNPTGGIKEDGTFTSSVITNNNCATFANTSTPSYLTVSSTNHRFYSYILYLSKL